MNIFSRTRAKKSDASSNTSGTHRNASGDNGAPSREALTPDTHPSAESVLSLLDVTVEIRSQLADLSSEQDVSEATRLELVELHHDLQRLLSRESRMGGGKPLANNWKTGIDDDFSTKFQGMMTEFESAEKAVQESLQNPVAVQPFTLDTIQKKVDDFFIMDNSLRETTVGQARGHTLEEKHKIVAAMAETGLEEVILGAFGSKISVDSQITEQWKSLGQSFDRTWGFSDAYDWEPIDEDPLWVDAQNYDEAKTANDYYSPPMIPKTKFEKKDGKLFKKASRGFRPNAFGKSTALKKVLSRSNSEEGRVPLGLLMMAGYGVCNANLEIDASLEHFDYKKFDSVKRLKFLINWCKENLAKREDGGPNRVMINLRDFPNYNRSSSGFEHALRIVDALSRLPPEERPFGFMMEEPTSLMFPNEVARVVRMIRVTMERAGFPEGHLLVHVHWNFGLAEASVLSSMVNGATGVWAAVCRAGAQTGHACSTMTAVNLFRAGHEEIAKKYDLEKMCEAARKVTEYTTRGPCPAHEEVYGKDAFDVPFIMTALPYCRYEIYHLLTKIGLAERVVRLNELSMVSSVHHAMTQHFGPSKETGWNPAYCAKMWEALHNHLLTGLSRDYNTPLGLGHLYGLVSKEKLPWSMVQIMTQNCPITDRHPVVLDFIYRWNRLCTVYEGKELSAHPAATSKSHMFWGLSAVTEPARGWLPFEYFMADVMRNPVLESIPRLFKMQIVGLLTRDERQIQRRKVPRISFYETILRLKLFIQEAESYHVLGLVDDFCVRKNHEYFFGEDALWLRKVNRQAQPKMANSVLLKHLKVYYEQYVHKGDTAISRCLSSAAKRINEQRAVPLGMQDAFSRESARQLVREIAEGRPEEEVAERDDPVDMSAAHERMLRGLAEDEGEDEQLAEQYSSEISMELGLEGLEEDVGESLADAYISESKAGLMETEDSAGAKSETLSKSSRPRRGSKQAALLRGQGSRFLQIMQDESSRHLLSTKQISKSLLSSRIDENSSLSNLPDGLDSDDDSDDMEAALAPPLFRNASAP